MNFERAIWILMGWNILLTLTVGFLLWAVEENSTTIKFILKDLAEFFKDVKKNFHVVETDLSKLGKAHNALAKDVSKFLED